MRLFENGMAEIRFFSFLSYLFDLRHIFYVLFLLCIPSGVFAQDNLAERKGVKKIEILNADVWEVDEKIDKDLQRLLGNVRLKHKEVRMTCDSAYYYKAKNQVKAYSKVHIEQGDTLDLYGDYLFYDATSENASVYGNVELIDKETHLFTKAIDYDVKNQIARYDKHGRITNADNVLTSIIGYYYVSENLFHFKDSVKIVNPDYVMTADTMDYNTKTETAFFTGPTELNGDSLYLYCEKGWYDTKMKVTSIWKKALIDNRKQIVHGDSLFFNDSTGYGESFGNVVIEDTTNNLIVKGNYAWYYKQPEQFMITDSAMFIQVSNEDSLFLHADTITAITVADKSAKGYRLMKAYYGCRIFSKDLQAKCDSLSYSFRDSVIRFYRAPVLWSEENQLTSDSMAIFTKNQLTDRMELYNSAFIVSQIDTLRFNQIKGRLLTGYFKNNELYKIYIKGNGESIYYLLDGENIAGENTSKCANTEIYLEKGKVKEVTDYESPEGFIDPPQIINPIPKRLTGFNWFNNLRPKKREDIFIE
ncbi:MAG: organic solvent tolerance protein OstA [Bacteroidetes bacterium]|nr:MAG: organic solvent tolerance protein OstA [Bacteroidota bacterium]